MQFMNQASDNTNRQRSFSRQAIQTIRYHVLFISLANFREQHVIADAAVELLGELERQGG